MEFISITIWNRSKFYTHRILNKIMKPILHLHEFSTYDYNSIYRADYPWFSYFNAPWVPIVAVVIYLFVSKPFFIWLRESFKIESKGKHLQLVTVIHSLLLAGYSGWTAFYTCKMIGSYIIENGLTAAVCDVSGDLWGNNDFSFWVTHFYISKLYEFVDTFIILLKGRKPSFLQTFHHAGIVLSMWGFTVTQASVVWIIVCFNSIIHTIMYIYYTLAAFGYKSPLKKYLTSLQIFQFLLGMSISLPYQLVSDCLSPSRSMVLGLTQVYTIILIVLFILFYIQSYLHKQSTSGDKKRT